MDTETTQTIERPTEEAKPETEVAAPEVKPTEAPKAFDPNSLAPDVKDYISKTYADYEKKKAMADEYDRVLKNPDFQQWYLQRTNAKPQTSAPAPKFELSDEQFSAALSDKSQFQNLVTELASQIVASQVAPQIQNTQREIDLAKRTNELNQVISKYPDFMELDKQGLIEPYLAKYGNISFEDAYWLGKKNTFNAEVDKKARGVVESKKRATVEKPGSPGGRSSKVKVANRLEAMEIAAEHYRRGQEPPDFEFE